MSRKALQTPRPAAMSRFEAKNANTGRFRANTGTSFPGLHPLKFGGAA
jgi:hypothetical protein